MTHNDDWRLQFLSEHLKGATLVRKRWTQRQPDWDHDHCALCFATFGAEGSGFLQVGYATEGD